MRTRDRSGSAAPSGPRARDGGLAAGKRARTDAMVQRATSGAAARDGDDAHAAAARGTAGAGQPLPHLGAIQRSFGRHDVTGVRAHLGEGAAAASVDLGALGYAFGDDVAFARSPDLHLAAHEAAHVVQQRAGVMLKDGLGDSGDVYERHADAVADRVVRGEPAEELLDAMTGGGAGRAVQRVDDEDTAARPPSRAERERAYAQAVEAAAIERMRGSYGDRGRVDLTPDGLRVEVRRGIRRPRLAGGVIEVPPPTAGEAPSDGVVEEVVGFAEQRDGRLGQRAAEAAGGFRRDELDIGTGQLTEPVFWVSPAYTGELYHVAAALEADPRHRYVLVDDPVERDERGLAVRVDELERAARRRARERAIALLGADRLATRYGDGGVIAYEERRRFLPLVQTTAISGAAMTPGSDHHDPGARGRVRDRLLGDGDEATAGQEAARAFLARRGAGAPALVDPLAPKVLIWVRRRGEHDPARDATSESLFQLATAAQARGMTPVFVGPAADEALPDGIDLTGHWRDPAFAGEGGLRAQLHMFDLLHREYGVVGQIGLKSGGMDGPALTGMPTISIGEPDDRRMRRWDGVDGIHRVETGGYDARSADPARRELDVFAVGSIEADLDGWAADAARRRAAALRSVLARRAARDDQPETATAARRALAAMDPEPSMAQLEVIALAADVGDDELSAAAQPAATADFHELMDRGDYAAATAAAARPDPRAPGDDEDDDVAADYDPRLLPPVVEPIRDPVPEVRPDTQVSVDPTGVTGIEVEVGVPTGEGQHVTTSFGYDVDVSAPYYHDDGYRIDGRLTWTGRFGGEAEYEQSHREIGASVHIGEVRTFVRRFATQAEAQAWYERATSGFNLHSWTEFGAPGTADEALALATGESRSVARQAGAEAEVSQELPIGVEVGASFGVDDERELVVIRADAGHVRLRVRTRTTARAGGTLGAGGFGMGLSGSRGVIAGREVEFDVADGSPGRAALTHALETRTLPEGESGDGWRQTEVTEGTTRGSGQSLEMAGVEVRFEQSVDDETVTAADGSQRRRITGRSAESASMLPDWLADGTMLEAGSQSTEMMSASGSGATITYVVDGTDARDSAIMLANVSGDASRLPAATGDDAGQWQVTTVLSEAQLVGFLRSCHSGAVRRHAHHLGTAAAAIDTLIAAVRAAGSRDDARAAAVAFVSETRDRGTAVIRAAIGGTITSDVSLQGSRAFEGAAGRERVRGQAAALRARLAAGEDAGAIAHEAMVLARAQRERVDAIGDTDRHRELPPAMRAREAALARELLTELEGLSAEARSARAASPEAPDADGGGDGAARDPDRLRAAYRHDLERMSRLHGQAQLAYRAVRAERDVHEGTAAVHFSATARERCHHEVSYDEADRLWHEARERWTDAERQRLAIEEQQADLDVDGPLSVNAEARVQSIRRKAWRGHDGYAASLRAFVALGHIYRDVRALLADERRAYFGATAFTPPEEPPEEV